MSQQIQEDTKDKWLINEKLSLMETNVSYPNCNQTADRNAEKQIFFLCHSCHLCHFGYSSKALKFAKSVSNDGRNLQELYDPSTFESSLSQNAISISV